MIKPDIPPLLFFLYFLMPQSEYFCVSLHHKYKFIIYVDRY